MRRNWELTTEEFLEEKNNIINEIEDYENKLIGLNRKDNSILEELDWMLELFINLNSLWKTASNEKKLEYIAKVVLELNFNNEKRL